MSKLDEMWAAFEAHKPDASYADEWVTMCRERTEAAAEAAWYAAPVGSAAKVAAAVASVVAASERYAQEAIDAIKEDKT